MVASAPIQIATATAVPQPTATAVPQPTATIMPATRATPRPTLTTDELAWLAWQSERLENVRGAINGLSEQAGIAGQNALIVKTAAWQAQTVPYLAVLRLSGAEMRQPPVVPERFAAIQIDMRAMGTQLVAVANDFAAGVDGFDATLIRRAAAGMERVRELIESINNKLDPYSGHIQRKAV
jgi:hypothetical protein